MTPHRCDPLTGGQGGPITIARVLRLLLARLGGEQSSDAAVLVLHEFAGCAHCLSVALLVMAGAAVGSMPERGPRVVAGLELQLAAALDTIASGRP